MKYHYQFIVTLHVKIPLDDVSIMLGKNVTMEGDTHYGHYDVTSDKELSLFELQDMRNIIQQTYNKQTQNDRYLEIEIGRGRLIRIEQDIPTVLPSPSAQ